METKTKSKTNDILATIIYRVKIQILQIYVIGCRIA